MSLAKERDRRGNAGSRMAKLLESQDDDEFYTTTYGGFNEEANDNDYQSERSESDAVDSDFSIDENDEVRSDLDDDEPKRKKRVMTKAYKEPVQKKTSTASDKPARKLHRRKKDTSTVQIYKSIDKKALRRSTAHRSKETEQREKERQARKQMMKDIAARKNVASVRRLTQNELLEEAKLTEEINLRSLELYRRLELEKKKQRVQKAVHHGPLIRYQSVTMPLIEELGDPGTEESADPEINVEEESGENGNEGTTDGEAQKPKPPPLKASEKCSRTFVTFTDEKIFKQYFPRKRLKAPVRQYCPVTRMPAKYFDPITQTPYNSAQAFRIIRETYSQQLEAKDG